MGVKKVGDLKVDELKAYLRQLKAMGRKNAVQTGKKTDLRNRLERIARNVGINPDGANWNAELATRGGEKKGPTTRAAAATKRAETERNAALRNRNQALKDLGAARRALVAKTEECEGIARDRNAWAAKARKVAFEIPARYKAPPERVERRLAPKKHLFYDDPAAKARARHEMAAEQKRWLNDEKMQRLRDAAAYRDYVRAKKHAYDAPLPTDSGSSMLEESARPTVRPVAKREAPRRVEKVVTRAEAREKAAREARRKAAAAASRAALERALLRARMAASSARDRKRRATGSASGGASRAAKRR